jgi:hypothetical protein
VDDIGFDPTLKKAVKEIKAIMRRHNIGGSMALVSKTHSEFAMHIPNWTGIKINLDKGYATIKINAETFPDTDVRCAVADNTVHFCFSTDKCLGTLTNINLHLKQQLSNAFDITEGYGEFTPHVEGVTTEDGLIEPDNTKNVSSIDQKRAKRGIDE